MKEFDTKQLKESWAKINSLNNEVKELRSKLSEAVRLLEGMSDLCGDVDTEDGCYPGLNDFLDSVKGMNDVGI